MRQKRPGSQTCDGSPRKNKMSASWRIIDTGPQEPFTNMAFDEAILRGYELHSSPPTLRIYGWKPSGISLGYSQDPEEVLDIEACLNESMPFVRRITGGGIILHGDELTYSLVCSKEDLRLPARVVSSYKIICSFLISFYKALGIEAEFASDSSSDETHPQRPSALCFAAKEKYDIVINGKKIGGSAQKRSKDIIFQHGSIPLSIDMRRASSLLCKKADTGDIHDSTSLQEVLGRRMSTPELSEILIRSFIRSFNVAPSAGRLSSAEHEIFMDLKTLKYASADWNYNRIDNAYRTALVGQ